MAALKEIKQKVGAVQKTKQITKAMNMVAASKYKSAQVRMLNFRPYAIKFMDVLNSVAQRVDSIAHPLLSVRAPKNICILSVTSDRGLCGAFNSNVIRATERFINEKKLEGRNVILIPLGRKGRDYFRKKTEIRDDRVDIFKTVNMDLAKDISKGLMNSFIGAEYDELYVIYNEFVNVSVQKPVVVKLFPLSSIGEKDEQSTDNKLSYLYEPSEPALIERLMPMYVHVLVYRALLETVAGENGARMVAMDNATRSCEDMISTLTLKYNKARQSAITAELMDIVGGTEALAQG